MDFDSPEEVREWVRDHADYVAALAATDDEAAPVARTLGVCLFGDGEPDPDDVAAAREIAREYIEQSQSDGTPDRLRNSLFGPPLGVQPVTDADLTGFGTAVARHHRAGRDGRQDQRQPAGDV